MEEEQIQKLNRFMDSVNADVDQRINEIIGDAEEKRSEMLKKAEDDALTCAYKKIQMAVKDIESKYHKLYAKREQELRKLILIHREELANKIFEDVKNLIIEFSNGDTYEQYLLSLISQDDIVENSTILLAAKDIKYKDKILNIVNGCTIEEDPSIILGGLSILNRDSSYVIDKTLDGALEEQIKTFSSNYSFSNN